MTTATGCATDTHRWRRATTRRPADCADCGALRCAGYWAGPRITVYRCTLAEIASPGGVASCADHVGNPGSTRC